MFVKKTSLFHQLITHLKLDFELMVCPDEFSSSVCEFKLHLVLILTERCWPVILLWFFKGLKWRQFEDKSSCQPGVYVTFLSCISDPITGQCGELKPLAGKCFLFSSAVLGSTAEKFVLDSATSISTSYLCRQHDAYRTVRLHGVQQQQHENTL